MGHYFLSNPRMLYRFADSFRAGPGWNCSSVLVLLCTNLYDIYYTIAECTVNKLLLMDRRTVRNMWHFMPE